MYTFSYDIYIYISKQFNWIHTYQLAVQSYFVLDNKYELIIIPGYNMNNKHIIFLNGYFIEVLNRDISKDFFDEKIGEDY